MVYACNNAVKHEEMKLYWYMGPGFQVTESVRVLSGLLFLLFSRFPFSFSDGANNNYKYIYISLLYSVFHLIIMFRCRH